MHCLCIRGMHKLFVCFNFLSLFCYYFIFCKAIRSVLSNDCLMLTTELTIITALCAEALTKLLFQLAPLGWFSSPSIIFIFIFLCHASLLYILSYLIFKPLFLSSSPSAGSFTINTIFLVYPAFHNISIFKSYLFDPPYFQHRYE